MDPVRGAISFLRRRHREVAPPEQVLPNGDLSVTWSDGTNVVYPRQVVTLAASTTIRRELTAVLRPLSTGDADEVRIESSTTETITIVQEDLPAFEAEFSGPVITEETVRMTLEVVAPSFRSRSWRVSDGDTTFWVTVEDASFWDSVQSGEAFAKGDFLVCRVRFRQVMDGDRLRLERDIVQVVEHRKPEPPPRLPI